MGRFDELMFIFPHPIYLEILSFIDEDELYDEYDDFVEYDYVAIPTGNYNRLRHDKRFKDYLFNICSYNYEKRFKNN